MGGQSNNLLWTYLTPRRVYRHEVSVADSSAADIALVHADVSTNAGPNVAPPTAGRVSGFGSTTTLAFSVVHDGGVGEGAKAVVTVWMLANAEGVGYSGTPAVYAAIAPRVKVSSHDVVGSALIMLREMPAAKYCVSVDTITGGGTVTIIEQHTE